ncbi:MAG TPA: hypothetical protein VN915_03120 [Elusimicrobiota bacterium]|nr:hypothetical protein [Elusimicrobiota bacterium]
MKVPALLLLAAALPSAALADGPAHRCDVEWLKKAQNTPLGGTIDDPNKYLKPGASAGEPVVIDILNPTKLCDATVWHSLAVLEPVGEPILDPRTRQPIGGVRLKWNDPALQAEWNKGLASQLKILIDADARYQRVDALGREALTQSEAVMAAAEKTGVASRTDAGTPAALKPLGLTGDQYVEDKGYTAAALAEAPAGTTQDPAELKAAFTQILDDDAPPKAPKAKPAKSNALAPKVSIVKYKTGTAVAAFRKAVVALANEVRGSHAAFADGDREAAVKFLTDPAIKKADDSGAYTAAALSPLDYGLRNLLALRAAAVSASLDAAKARLKGQSVAGALATDHRLPANQTSADMSAAVLRHLQGVKDYSDLSAMYDKESAHPDSDWMKANGSEVKAQLEAYRADAAKTSVVVDAATKGRALQYSIGGQKVTDSGIAVAELDKSQAYRETIAEAVAQNIGTAPMNAKSQALLAALRGEGGAGTAVAAPLTPDQQKAAGELPGPVQTPVVVAAPPSPYDALLKASPAQGFLGKLFSPKGSVERYYSKANEAAADEAHARLSRRVETEAAANDAAEAEQARQEAARSRLAAAPSDPDDSASVAAAKRAAALADFDAKAKAAVQAAHDGVIKADKGYMPADKAAADLKAKRDALNATVDAAYTDGVNKAVAALNAAYKTKGTKQYAAAQSRSGYDTFYDQKLARVDQYFTQNWAGAGQAVNVAKCKAALGFKMDGDGSGFKDPSPDNVDKRCGVQDGLVTVLRSFRGSNTAMPAAPK